MIFTPFDFLTPGFCVYLCFFQLYLFESIWDEFFYKSLPRAGKVSPEKAGVLVRKFLENNCSVFKATRIHVSLGISYFILQEEPDVLKPAQRGGGISRYTVRKARNGSLHNPLRASKYILLIV